jgi:methionyl-tRNA synthetase
MGSFYITTAIPYVNAGPHLGFALELVQADVLARYLTGTDENSLTNVLAAEHAGVPVRALVDRNAGAFRALVLPQTRMGEVEVGLRAALDLE